MAIHGAQVFSGTKARDRDELGDRLMRWQRDNPAKKVVKVHVVQSSDFEYHCLTIVAFWEWIL